MLFPLGHKMPRWKVSRSSIAAKKGAKKKSIVVEVDEHDKHEQLQEVDPTPEPDLQEQGKKKFHVDRMEPIPEVQEHGTTDRGDKGGADRGSESANQQNLDSELIEDYFESDGDGEYFSCDEWPRKDQAAERHGESGTGVEKK
ncbi:MAG: hypothetical protein Q9168_004057 [Polycauliona sp. 1 TL-2023]